MLASRLARHHAAEANGENINSERLAPLAMQAKEARPLSILVPKLGVTIYHDRLHLLLISTGLVWEKVAVLVDFQATHQVLKVALAHRAMVRVVFWQQPLSDDIFFPAQLFCQVAAA